MKGRDFLDFLFILGRRVFVTFFLDGTVVFDSLVGWLVAFGLVALDSFACLFIVYCLLFAVSSLFFVIHCSSLVPHILVRHLSLRDFHHA